MKIKITWKIDEFNENEPKSFIFDTDDYMSEEDWNALDEDEQREFFEEATDAEFMSKVSWYIDKVEKI